MPRELQKDARATGSFREECVRDVTGERDAIVIGACCEKINTNVKKTYTIVAPDIVKEPESEYNSWSGNNVYCCCFEGCQNLLSGF